MQAKIIYLLTEQAQRAAMVATGQPVARKQETTEDIPADALALMSVSSDGAITLDVSKADGRLAAAGWKNGGLFFPVEANSLKTAAEIIADLRRGQTLLAEEKQREAEVRRKNDEHNRAVTEAAYRAFLADPAARAYTARDIVKGTQSPADWWPEAHTEFAAEIKRRNEADAAARKAAEEAKEQAKLEYIDRWIAEHADEDVREQHQAGLLARPAALAMIAKAAFAEAGLPDAHKVKVCKTSDCPCGIDDLDAIPPAVYRGWRPYKGKLPADTVVEFERSRDCEAPDDEYGPADYSASDPYYTALVKMPVGPFVFERRIKL